MLKQLTSLSLQGESRYATDEELSFLTDYLESLDHRISAYEKIRDAEEEIIDQVELEMLSKNDNIFLKGDKDISPICKRDRTMTMRHTATAILLNDLERLREGLLLWQQTIVITAFKDEHLIGLAYQITPEVLKKHLDSEEMSLLTPALNLIQSTLR